MHAIVYPISHYFEKNSFIQKTPRYDSADIFLSWGVAERTTVVTIKSLNQSKYLIKPKIVGGKLNNCTKNLHFSFVRHKQLKTCSFKCFYFVSQAAHRYPLDIFGILIKKIRISEKLFQGCPKDIQMSLLKISLHGNLGYPLRISWFYMPRI